MDAEVGVWDEGGGGPAAGFDGVVRFDVSEDCGVLAGRAERGWDAIPSRISKPMLFQSA
jgi:hypothetical protein